MDWTPVDSSRIAAIAYDPNSETIYVRFKDDIEWFYAGCPQHIWEEFCSPATSKGRYIHDVLDHHPNGRFMR